VKADRIGDDKVIGLRVADERTVKKLGEVGDPDRKMVDVVVEEDPAPVIYETGETGIGPAWFLGRTLQ
jgi:hypothetical protein